MSRGRAGQGVGRGGGGGEREGRAGASRSHSLPGLVFSASCLALCWRRICAAPTGVSPPRGASAGLPAARPAPERSSAASPFPSLPFASAPAAASRAPTRPDPARPLRSAGGAAPHHGQAGALGAAGLSAELSQPARLQLG